MNSEAKFGIARQTKKARLNASVQLAMLFAAAAALGRVRPNPSFKRTCLRQAA